MTPGFILLFYVCAAPAEGIRNLSCAARDVMASTCAEGIVMAEATLAPDRLMFVAACVATTGVPRPAQRQQR